MNNLIHQTWKKNLDLHLHKLKSQVKNGYIVAFALRQRLPKFCFSIHGLLIFLSKFKLVIIALVLLWMTYCECTIKSVVKSVSIG